MTGKYDFNQTDLALSRAIIKEVTDELDAYHHLRAELHVAKPTIKLIRERVDAIIIQFISKFKQYHGQQYSILQLAQIVVTACERLQHRSDCAFIKDPIKYTSYLLFLVDPSTVMGFASAQYVLEALNSKKQDSMPIMIIKHILTYLLTYAHIKTSITANELSTVLYNLFATLKSADHDGLIIFRASLRNVDTKQFTQKLSTALYSVLENKDQTPTKLNASINTTIQQHCDTLTRGTTTSRQRRVPPKQREESTPPLSVSVSH